MANFTGYQPLNIPHFGGKVQWDDPTQLSLGLAETARNLRFTSEAAAPRYGTRKLLNFGGPIGGFGIMRYLAPNNSGKSNVLLVGATQNDGNIKIASPYDQSSLKTLTDAAFSKDANISPQPNLYTQFCMAYNRMMAAQSDLILGVAPPLVIDGATQTISPLSDLPFGDTWKPNKTYRAGQVVTAVNQKGRAANLLFRCKTSGTSGASEPTWPVVAGQTVTEKSGDPTWELVSITANSGLTAPPAPILAGTTADSASAITDGATAFIVCTWTNQYGESVPTVRNPDGTLSSHVLEYKNTTGSPVSLNIALPAVPPELASLASQYKVTGCNVYVYIVTGTPSQTRYTDPSYYALAGQDQPTASISISAIATGRNPPTENTAYTTDVGNVSSGTRYMIVLYENSDGYITGVTGPVPVRCDITVDGRKMLVQGIPVGPYNCVARICAFTVAGQSSAGPYFYIPKDDYVDPGDGADKILQTATKINDNVTKEAYFDFIDPYLEGSSNVTNYFNRIEVPPCTDIYFSKRMNRVVYSGAKGYPSTVLVSDIESPQTVRIPGSNLDVAPEDGDRVICYREMREMQIVFKENGAHYITPNTSADPRSWKVEELWSGMGPCGPRALDIYTADLSQGSEGRPFIAFAHRSGPYFYYSGAPTLMREMLKDWETINWECAAQIRTCIDPISREIRFHVPTGTSKVNNKTLTINFYFGMDPPAYYSVWEAKWRPDPRGRKYSVDDLAVNDAHFMPRRTAYNNPGA